MEAESPRERYCGGCEAYELGQSNDGQWYVDCEDHPEDRIYFDSNALMLEWLGIMLDHEEGPWRLHVRRGDNGEHLFSGESAKKQLRDLEL